MRPQEGPFPLTNCGSAINQQQPIKEKLSKKKHILFSKKLQYDVANGLPRYTVILK